jgi:hypothetical protein
MAHGLSTEQGLLAAFVAAHGLQAALVAAHGLQAALVVAHGLQVTVVAAHGLQDALVATHGLQAALAVPTIMTTPLVSQFVATDVNPAANGRAATVASSFCFTEFIRCTPNVTNPHSPVKSFLAII